MSKENNSQKQCEKFKEVGKKHNFDFLLLNSFGTKNERFINQIINILLKEGAVFVGSLGIIHSLQFAFPAIILNALNLCFILICVIFIYVNVVLFINGHSKKPPDNIVLVCKAKSKIHHKLLDMLEFVFFMGFFFAFMMLAIVSLCPAVFGIWLWLVNIAKPFLLKEVVLYENCVIVRYRILGDIRLGLENLALIGEGVSGKNEILARIKKEEGVIRFWIICYNIDSWDNRLENKAQLKEWLDKRLGFSVDKISYPKALKGLWLNRMLRD
ncbi:hypothetical protein [Helicobacter sp. T3_23-1059]